MRRYAIIKVVHNALGQRVEVSIDQDFEDWDEFCEASGLIPVPNSELEYHACIFYAWENGWWGIHRDEEFVLTSKENWDASITGI